MHPTAVSGTKIYPDRAIPGSSAKVASMAPPSHQSPSRPASTAPISKIDKERTKSPLVAGEEISNIKDTDQRSPLSPDTLRGHTPVNAVNSSLDSASAANAAFRGPPGTNVTTGFVPHPFFTPGMNLNNVSQQGYGPPPQMQFYTPNFNPNAYGQSASSTRPGSAIPKFQGVDPKYPPAQAQLAPSNPSPQMQNHMTRRQSNYFVPPPMSPVQTSYGPRGWIPNTATMLPGPMPLQNGNGSIQGPAMYQPAMIAPNANPALLTPPGAVPPTYTPAFAPAAVPNPSFGYPTPPETSGVNLPPDIPPAIPSVYPDPAYSNINNCIYNPKGTTNVYIRGLRPETSDEDLLHMVRHYGTIISTKAIIDTQTKMCKGYDKVKDCGSDVVRFGFAKFDTIEQGVACIIALSAAGYQCSFAKVLSDLLW